jgi:hypothetical protein
MWCCWISHAYKQSEPARSGGFDQASQINSLGVSVPLTVTASRASIPIGSHSIENAYVK